MVKDPLTISARYMKEYPRFPNFIISVRNDGSLFLLTHHHLDGMSARRRLAYGIIQFFPRPPFYHTLNLHFLSRVTKSLMLLAPSGNVG